MRDRNNIGNSLCATPRVIRSNRIGRNPRPKIANRHHRGQRRPYNITIIFNQLGETVMGEIEAGLVQTSKMAGRGEIWC